MKKIILFIIVVVLAASCKPKVKDLLVGTWYEKSTKKDVSWYRYAVVTFNDNGTGVFNIIDRNWNLLKTHDFAYQLFKDNKNIQISYEYDSSEIWTMYAFKDTSMTLELKGVMFNLLKEHIQTK